MGRTQDETREKDGGCYGFCLSHSSPISRADNAERPFSDPEARFASIRLLACRFRVSCHGEPECCPPIINNWQTLSCFILPIVVSFFVRRLLPRWVVWAVSFQQPSLEAPSRLTAKRFVQAPRVSILLRRVFRYWFAEVS